MADEVKDVLERALRLPSEARAALAGSLIRSLDPDLDERVEQAWAEEIESRIREIDSGQVSAIPWPEVRARLHRVLDDRKSS